MNCVHIVNMLQILMHIGHECEYEPYKSVKQNMPGKYPNNTSTIYLYRL